MFNHEGMIMKRVFSVLAVAMLASCGGGGSESVSIQDDGFNTDGPVVNACASNYYTELVGDYDGQISYTKADDSLSCTWEVDLQVSGGYTMDPVNRRVCDLTMNMASTSTNPVGCSDVGLAGDVSEPLKSLFTTADELTNPTWPVEADTLLNSRLPDSAVYPVGETGTVLVITLTFDGAGNVIFPASLNASPEWSGVIVKK